MHAKNKEAMAMLKIIIFSAINPKQKAGYFNAVDDRVKLLKANSKIKVYSYSIYKSGSLLGMSIKKDLQHTFIEYPKILPSDGIFSFLTILIMQFISFIFIVKTKPDIVHAHWGYPLGYSVVSLKAFFRKAKFIITFHGSDVHTHPFRSSNIFKKTKSLCNNADHICAVSRHLKNQIRENFCSDEKKLSITYNGLMIDPSKGTRKFSDDPIFAFVGNLNTTKGADRIIPLYEMLKQTLKDKFCFVIAGDGPVKKTLENYIYKNKIEDMLLLGAVQRSEAINLIKISECLFILSRREGLGLSGIEGIVYSKLCLAMSVGGLPEIFSGNEHLLNNGDFDANLFVSKIIAKRNGYLKMDRTYVLNNFSLMQVHDTELKLYEHLLLKG